jgi:amino acid transporter
MKDSSIKTNTKFRQTDRKKRLVIGGVIAFLLAITPFLFYLYKYAPDNSKVWETAFFTFESKGFSNAQNFIHALFTKITLVIITSLWFVTAKHWWKWAILIPLTMFLFQLLGVINFQKSYMDDFDFWYSLPIIMPIVVFLIWISHELNKTIGDLDLKDEIEEELESYKKSI